MKIKKFLAGILAGTMLFSAVACGSDTTTSTDGTASEGTTSAGTTATGDTINVGVCIYKFDDNFMTLYRQELQRYMEKDLAEKVGKTFKVQVQDGKNDQAEQTNQIQNYIANDVDILIVNLVQSSAGQTVVDMCKEADIPVIFINREPEASVMASYDKATYVGADARQSGTYQGEIILATENKGDINGDGVVNYIMIQGDPENVDAQYRTENSIKALTDAGMEVNQLDIQRADWDQAKAQEIVANDLTQFGDEIEVVFCNNDSMALGAKQALEAQGRVINEDVYLVGVDALEEMVSNVENGTVTGTVFNDYLNQAATAANVAYMAYQGEHIEDIYPVDYIKITTENASVYVDEAKTAQQALLDGVN